VPLLLALGKTLGSYRLGRLVRIGIGGMLTLIAVAVAVAVGAGDAGYVGAGYATTSSSSSYTSV
jgi:hypothetical protein